ncbi:hypothetical protein ACF0H5_016840 [Mactra antiquata]
MDIMSIENHTHYNTELQFIMDFLDLNYMIIFHCDKKIAVWKMETIHFIWVASNKWFHQFSITIFLIFSKNL